MGYPDLLLCVVVSRLGRGVSEQRDCHAPNANGLHHAGVAQLVVDKFCVEAALDLEHVGLDAPNEMRLHLGEN
jgi:hypothetical protein